MKVKLLAVAAALIAGAVLSAPAMAECIYPKAPGSAPNGSTATKEEMIAAKQAFEKYQNDVNAYMNCLDMEANASVAKVANKDKPEGAERVTQIKDMANKRHNAAIDELQARADEFNAQLHAYKEKNK